MHIAVSGVRKAKTIGNKTSAGEFHIVKLKVCSDAHVATLGLAAVDAHVVDAGRHLYDRDLEAEANLSSEPSFERRISAESFEKEIVFDLPSDIQNPRLAFARAMGWITPTTRSSSMMETAFFNEVISNLRKAVRTFAPATDPGLSVGGSILI